MKKKTWYKIVCIFFALLTVIGTIYIAINNWMVNTGYVFVPLIFCLIFLLLATKEGDNE